MEINSIPEEFQNKKRLAIVSSLLIGEKTFSELKIIADTTDGNLGAQLKKLEETGYIFVKKEFVNRKPQSTYAITEKGIQQFKQYVKMLEQILNNADTLNRNIGDDNA